MSKEEKTAMPAGRHLDQREIERLSSGDAGSGDVLEQAMLHLDSCVECRFRVLESFPRNASEKVPARPHAREDCPLGAKWLELAAGILAEDAAALLLDHASNCPGCRQRLKAAMEDLVLETTREEEEKIAALPSAQADAQIDLAARLSRRSRPKHIVAGKSAQPLVLRMFSPRWSQIAAAVLLTAGAWWLWSILSAPSVDKMLAQAYTERRVMELRIPGAAYAPKRVTRGIAQSARDLPQSLQDANALISRQAKTHPDDPQWLEAGARADLLELNYESAIQNARRALDIQPDSLPAMMDLAGAYYQRAEANNDRAIDYGEAVEYLSRVLAKTPDDPVALFNRAISEEKLSLYDPAIGDWQRYLRLDSQGDWADEARKRLAQTQAKVNKKQSSLRKPLLTPAQLESLSGTAQAAEEIDGRVEDYLRVALREWLPKAFSPVQSTESQLARTALDALAEVTKEKHQDWWLADLLDGSCGATCSQGAAALASALHANDKGDYAQGISAARQAASLFAAAHNQAGELMAQTEEVYANSLSYNGSRCMAQARGLISRLQLQRYEWLHARLSLEQASCASLLGDLGGMQAAIREGTAGADSHHYSALFLRGLGFQAESNAFLGYPQQGFALASRGLDFYWSGQADLMKGFNLYTDLSTAADILRLPYLQVALYAQATVLIDLHPDIVQRAVAHQWFGNAAYLANMPVLAEHEFAIAGSLFAVAPQTEATLRGRMDAEIWLAGFEARKGELEQSRVRLQKAQDNLKQIPSFGPRVRFYSTKAELGLRSKDFGVTETALRTAIFLSEWSLRSVTSENTRIQWSRQTEPAYRNLVAWKLLQGDNGAALEFWEWYKGAGFRSANSDASQAPGDLDSSIAPDEQNAPPLQIPSLVAGRLPSLRAQTVISYAVLPEGLAAWVYDDRGVFYQWIAVSPAKLESRVMQFQRLCSSPDSSLAALRSTARSLYDILIAPIENRLAPDRTLVFELDGVLSAIPMEALVGKDGRYLGLRAAVASISGLYQTSREHPAVAITPASPALIVSVPAPADKRFAPLAEAANEAKAVAESFRSARLLNGPKASIAAILRELRGSAVFHFTGHAVAIPEMNGLVLAEMNATSGRPRLLDAQSLAPEALKDLQLAVLSACDTDADTGNGAAGGSVAQALFRAGVPHVLASRWSVDSVETAEFMRQFYGRLRTGSSVTAALHAAQQALASQPSSAHPYYWAAFGVQGL